MSKLKEASSEVVPERAGEKRKPRTSRPKKDRGERGDAGKQMERKERGRPASADSISKGVSEMKLGDSNAHDHSNEEKKKGNRRGKEKPVYHPYLSEQQVEEGLKNKTLYRGVLRLTLNNPDRGFVTCEDFVRDIHLKSKDAQNRAMHDDIVAVRVLRFEVDRTFARTSFCFCSVLACWSNVFFSVVGEQLMRMMKVSRWERWWPLSSLVRAIWLDVLIKRGEVTRRCVLSKVETDHRLQRACISLSSCRWAISLWSLETRAVSTCTEVQ